MFQDLINPLSEVFEFIHPDEIYTLTEPDGAPYICFTLICIQRNMNKDRVKLPAAET